MSPCVSVILMVVAFVNGARIEDDIQSCAKVQTASAVVPLGSPVTATCIIRDDCPLATGQDVQWRLNDRLIPGISVASDSGRIYKVAISDFNHTRAFLTCCVQASPIQVVGGVEIRAGYPPLAPQNLSCQTNLTTPNTLTCSWDPGQQETHLPTKYTLHTKIWDSNEKQTYELPTGLHQYTIPRSGFVFFSEMEIYVKAVNELGEATSLPMVLEPVSVAKFDPPRILKVEVVPKRYGCLKLRWGLSPHQAWMHDFRLNLEVRLKTADSSHWSEQPVIKPTRPVDQCRLRHGTEYFAQIRVRYRQSPWSEWSSSQSGVTLESAPTGRLDSWLKVSGDHTHKQLTMHLFWKPSQQFRANSQNVSYVVSVQKLPAEKGKLCSTPRNYCTFQLPRKAKKVYLSAVNAAGKSSPTEVRIYQIKRHTVISEIKAIPRDDRSLLVQWRSVDASGLTGYVVEWSPLLKTDPSFIQFETADRNQSSLVITGSFEPYKPYGISVYPRFKDGIGLPQTVNAYSRQRGKSPKTPGGSHKENGIIQITIVMIVIAFGVGLSLLIIFIVVTCFSNHKRLKGHFWPIVPDPANSSIKKWTSDSAQEKFPAWDKKESNPIYLSHLSFLNLPMKLSKEEDDLWSNSAEDTSDLGESICGSPFIPGYSGSNSDSVPYATVIFSSPCCSPPPNEPHVYLRSESTQPLLETEESFSPKCYQNMASDGMSREQCFFGPCDDCIPEEGANTVIHWDDFPFLQALTMNDTPND
uniref:Colony stimulating factor 3 receptor n=1 Tax=Mastacembelus armatus TaxID=205130 RepID=A0A7N8YLA3_9TELE